jgi:hypothetical protein
MVKFCNVNNDGKFSNYILHNFTDFVKFHNAISTCKFS